jgi:hypothetical protein
MVEKVSLLGTNDVRRRKEIVQANIDVVDAKPEHAEGLVDLMQRMYPDEEYPLRRFYSLDWTKKKIERDECIWKVGLDKSMDDHVMGMGIVEVKKKNKFYITYAGSLIIDSEHSGYGIFSKIVQRELSEILLNLRIELGDGGGGLVSYTETKTVPPKLQRVFEEKILYSPVGFSFCQYKFDGHEQDIQVIPNVRYLFPDDVIPSREKPVLIPELKELHDVVLDQFTIDDFVEETEIFKYSISERIKKSFRTLYGRIVGKLDKVILVDTTYLNEDSNKCLDFYISQDEAHLVLDDYKQFNAIIDFKMEDTRNYEPLLDEIFAHIPEDTLFVEATATSYQPELQRALYDRGFRPFAYIPGYLEKGESLYDVIKFGFTKCKVPDVSNVELTDATRRVAEVVLEGFNGRNELF